MAVTKQRWRARLLAARRARPEPERAAARRAVAEHLLVDLTAPRAAGGPEATGRPGATGRPADTALTVCAFHPLPTEPLAPDLAERLAQAGLRVLVPLARPGEPLDWCELSGPTVTGMLGVSEPTGPRLGPEAIRLADVVLVPALAVDGEGFRLGRGGGHYDRSLALLATEHAGRAARAGAGPPRLIAVVFDEEMIDRLPHDGHDMPVTDVATPRGGLRHVARRGRPGASSN